MPRGITRTGNPFHRVPLLFTTRDSEGNLVSFMPGGPRILEARKQDVVVCMTLDAENNEIPIPFMGGDIGVVEDASGLSENPPDGLIAIVEKGALRTEGRQLQQFDEVATAYFAFEMQLEDIVGIVNTGFTTCKFGQYTGSLTVLFLEDAEQLEMGISGPMMLIANGDDESFDLLYIRVKEAGLLEIETGELIFLDAGWNKLVKTNDIWRQTPIALSAVPAITDAVVGESENLYSSTTEWFWVSSLAYSLGGEWHGELKPQLPEFIASFPEYDDEVAHMVAHTANMYSLARYINGESKAPDPRAYVAIMSGHLNVSGSLCVAIPVSTLHTTAAVKAALETKLSAFITLSFDVAAPVLTIEEFEYFDGAHSEGEVPSFGSWSGRVVWRYVEENILVKEPYLHQHTPVSFYN